MSPTQKICFLSINIGICIGLTYILVVEVLAQPTLYPTAVFFLCAGMLFLIGFSVISSVLLINAERENLRDKKK